MTIAKFCVQAAAHAFSKYTNASLGLNLSPILIGATLIILISILQSINTSRKLKSTNVEKLEELVSFTLENLLVKKPGLKKEDDSSIFNLNTLKSSIYLELFFCLIFL